MKKNIIIVIVAVAAFISLIVFYCYVSLGSLKVQPPAPVTAPIVNTEVNVPTSPSVTINGQVIKVTLAQTKEEQEKGLGGVKSLAADQGMLFVFPTPGIQSFWMMGMLFDLDFVWIRDSRVVDLSENISSAQDSQYDIVSPREAINYVLEVPAGTIQRLGVKVGDAVNINK